MVSLQNYYDKVIVSIYPDSLDIKMRLLLDEVIIRLPNEEQFGLTGTILFGPRVVAANFYKKITSDPKFGLGPSMNLSLKDGNYAFWIRENLQDSEFLITIII